MGYDGWLYLGVTGFMLLIFSLIALRTYKPGNRKKMEEPKNRMLED